MKKISVSILVHAALTVSLVALFAPDLFAQTYAPRHSTKLTIDGDNNGQAEVTIRLPGSLLTPYTLTLPAGVGAAGQSLITTDASGTLGWATITGSNTGDITLLGSPNYLSLTGQALTMNAIDLSNTSNTSANALPISRGGTNSTTALVGSRPIVSTATTIGENNATLTDTYLPLWNAGYFANSSLVDNGTTVSTAENFTMSGAKTMTLGTASSGTGSLALANGTNANLTTIQAGTATAGVTYKLPTANGTSGQALTTDGNSPAQLSWTTISGGGGTGSGFGSIASFYYARSPVNTTVSSTTPVNVNGMSFPVGAGEMWGFEMQLSAHSTTAGGFVVGLTFPTLGVMEAEALGFVDYGGNGHTTSFRITSSGTMVGGSQPFVELANGDGGVRVSGMIDNSAGSAGTVQLQFALAGTNTGALIYKNSFVHAWKMATSFEQTYATGTTTITVPSGVTKIYVSGVGAAGGGGGGGADNNTTTNGRGSAGGGGGAGEYVSASGLTVVPGETLTISVGAAGSAGSGGVAGVNTAPTAGGSGGASTITGNTSGLIFQANGGSGGGAGVNAQNGASGTPGGTAGAGGVVAGSTPSAYGTAGTSGGAGTTGSGGTANIAGASGGNGPTGGAANTGGNGGYGSGNTPNSVTANGGAGAAGTGGYITISY